MLQASSIIKINGLAVALEGDPIFCPACKTVGKLTCTGPRLRETCMGKQVGLENDLCSCGCATSPRLIASQQLRAQNLKGSPSTVPATAAHGVAPSVHSSISPSALNEISDSDDEIQYALLDEAGSPLPQYRYDLFNGNTQTVRNSALEEGHTQSLPAGADVRMVAWLDEDGVLHDSEDRRRNSPSGGNGLWRKLFPKR